MSRSSEQPQPPPLYDPVNSFKVSSETNSKITDVVVYPSLAQVTRLYKFHVKVGLNRVTITGLPSSLEHGTLRVDGRGTSTIHEVTVHEDQPSAAPTSSKDLDQLQEAKAEMVTERDNHFTYTGTVTRYLKSLSEISIRNASQLDGIFDICDATMKNLSVKMGQMQKTIDKLDDDIESEKAKLAGSVDNNKLTTYAVVDIFGESNKEVEIGLTYAVKDAGWKAVYEIRADTDITDGLVTLVYNAGITQNTGEDWTNVSLRLEAEAPDFKMQIPSLEKWTISAHMPRKQLLSSFASVGSYGDDDFYQDTGRRIAERTTYVALSGEPIHTWPLITVSGNGVLQKFSIERIEIKSRMSWSTVPKEIPRVYCAVKITNIRNYALLKGAGNVYMNECFIGHLDVPLVFPGDSFVCHLGQDPSIHVAYLPTSVETTKHKSRSNHSFMQRIRVRNSRSKETVVKVFDQFPVAYQSEVAVKHIQPALTVTEHSAYDEVPSIPIGHGITAQWVTPDSEYDTTMLGQSGKFFWNCSIPPKGTIELTLSYEVNGPLVVRNL